eukprot:TRINITY_DN64014_c0_g1_i1.p1 TRINITY_DN64014_c0_g1~~TRINITY_DN64014_c0_g1_i1.p1  ORF type:complete len:240 (-),score=8.29 TRINITY_DN64014_c0_g1_i1:120-839(-)
MSTSQFVALPLEVIEIIASYDGTWRMSICCRIYWKLLKFRYINSYSQIKTHLVTNAEKYMKREGSDEYPHWKWSSKHRANPTGFRIAEIENAQWVYRKTRPRTATGRIEGVRMYGDATLSIFVYKRIHNPNLAKLVAGLLNKVDAFTVIPWDNWPDHPSQDVNPPALLGRFGRGWPVSDGNCGTGPNAKWSTDPKDVANVDDLICPDAAYALSMQDDGNFWDVLSVGPDFVYHYKFFTS